MPPREFEAKHRWMECEDSATPTVSLGHLGGAGWNPVKA